MKKILVMGAAVIGLMLGASATASASTPTTGYPPEEPNTPTWIGPLEGTPGQKLTYTVDNVLPGEVVTVVIGDSTFSAVAGNAAAAYEYRTVSVSATAPSKVGKYPSSISVSGRNLSAQFTFTVKPGGDGGDGDNGGNGGGATTSTMAPKSKLPATGSGSAGTMAAWALALLGGGSALVYVSKRRNIVG